MGDAPTTRHAVRVLLVDEHERVLLIKIVLPETGRAFWNTPGGGIEPGEDAATAAAREVFEETGLRPLPPITEVWRRRYGFTYRGVDYDQHERCFIARTAHFDPDPGDLTEEEAVEIAQWRWWTLEQLEQTDEQLAPDDLATRLRTLLRDGPPAPPSDIGN